MSRTLKDLGLGVTDPRKMMLIAGLFAGLGLLTGYVEVHRQADRALALRQGPPPATTLQSISASEDADRAGEVTLHAEAAFDHAVRLSYRGGETPQDALVVPLFPLSAAGALHIQGSAAIEPNTPGTVLGYLFHPLGEEVAQTPRPDVLAASVFGTGLHGTVIEVNGALREDSDYTLLAQGAFTAMGLSLAPQLVSIRPFVDGRTAALTPEPASNAHRVLFLLAMIVMVVSVVVSMRGAREDQLAMWDLPERDTDSDAPTPHHPKFTPIPSQQALYERAKRREAAAVDGLGRLLKNRP